MWGEHIMENIKENKQRDLTNFAIDVFKMFANAKIQNPSGNPIHKAAANLEEKIAVDLSILGLSADWISETIKKRVTADD